MTEKKSFTQDISSKYLHFGLAPVVMILVGLCLFALSVLHRSSALHSSTLSMAQLPTPGAVQKLNTDFASPSIYCGSSSMNLDSKPYPMATYPRIHEPKKALRLATTDNSQQPNILAANGWSGLSHDGLNGWVEAIAVMGDDLYVGGEFDATADGKIKGLNNIAKYSNGVWSALADEGLNSDVYALIVVGNDLYVAGRFNTTFDGKVPDLNNIAKYSNDAWSALANGGLDGGWADRFALIGNDLYVSGLFSNSADCTVKGLHEIAKYSGEKWSALQNLGLGCCIRSIATSGNDLYVGGQSGPLELNEIAKYNNGVWSGFSHKGLNAGVLSILPVGNDLYVGGFFQTTGDSQVKDLNYIARYNSDIWSALPYNGLDGRVDILAIRGNDLYVGGEFVSTFDSSGLNFNGIAKYNDGGWSALPNQGLKQKVDGEFYAAQVSALTVSGSDLYAGGRFDETADGAVTNLGNIAVLHNSQSPVIVIPGIGGSRLASGGEELWPASGRFSDDKHKKLTLNPDEAQVNVVATDILRNVGPSNFYKPLLDFLTSNGFVEYQVNNDPTRRTESGCNLSQKAQNPNLFVFAYDWRQDNGISANSLAEYVKCVRLFYPNSKINIIASSMGSLVARRYILDHLNTHGIDNLITVGAPWLGVPKAIMALETGKNLLPGLVISPSVLRNLFQFFPGAHQLLPSESYFNLGGQPLQVEGQDYSFNQMVDFLDQQFSTKPGTTTDSFHKWPMNTSAQDDWRNDESGVTYSIIFGVEKKDGTINKITASFLESNCFGDPGAGLCASVYTYDAILGKGDTTVPEVSSKRMGIDSNGDFINLNGNATLYQPTTGDQTHLGLTQNKEVQNLILRLLIHQIGDNKVIPAHTVQEAPTEPAYYMRMREVGEPVITDASGHSTAPRSDTGFGDYIPGLVIDVLGQDSYLLVLSKDQPYTVTFTTLDKPIALEITEGTGVTSTRAIRYRDLVLPAHASAGVKFTPQGIEPLYFDSDKNGSLDTKVTPKIDVSGQLASDRTPPTVSITHTQDGEKITISINAIDNEAGIAKIYYSLDGAHFKLYSEPFTLEKGQAQSIYAFADDKVANRSSLVIHTLPQTVYLPLIRR